MPSAGRLEKGARGFPGLAPNGYLPDARKAVSSSTLTFASPLVSVWAKAVFCQSASGAGWPAAVRRSPSHLPSSSLVRWPFLPASYFGQSASTFALIWSVPDDSFGVIASPPASCADRAERGRAKAAKAAPANILLRMIDTPTEQRVAGRMPASAFRSVRPTFGGSSAAPVGSPRPSRALAAVVRRTRPKPVAPLSTTALAVARK